MLIFKSTFKEEIEKLRNVQKNLDDSITERINKTPTFQAVTFLLYWVVPKVSGIFT
jgi:hypothetical protein